MTDTTLQAGQTISHYRIVEKIGSGGMGQVWLAEDERLQRKVALKALPPWTTDDARLRGRFEREAKAVASLNHPNIVTIHSVEDADGILFLTLELIEGEPLTRHMNASIPLDKLFDLAIPLTDAVAAAHDRGILHRDLKPDNVMVTSIGIVKVLDFGLAKLREQATEEHPEQLSGDTLTREGKIVGTTAYMSPEQAEGSAVGPESDVFSLGIILYQMATGKRPFSGKTPISIVSSIIKDTPPPITDLNRDLPPQLGRIVRRCLAKDPTRRYGSARELRNELEFLREELESPGEAESIAARRRPQGILPVALIALALAVVAVAVGWLRSPGGGSAGEFGASVSQQTFYGGVETNPSLSPDGHFLAYASLSERGDSDIFLQRVDGRNPINLTEESEAYEGTPAFSPDGERIAFRSNRGKGGLYLMGATGESVRRLTDFGFDPAWSPDGKQIAFATEQVDSPLGRSTRSKLHIVDVESGDTREIYDGDAVQPSWSPDGSRIAFWTAHVGDELSGQRDIGTIRIDGSSLVMATADFAVDWCPHWSSDAKNIYFASDRGGSMNLWRIPVDQGSGGAKGPAEPTTTPSLWAGPFSISGDGTRIAYVAQDDRSRLIRVAFAPEVGAPAGEPTTITRGALIIFRWAVSPDGEWIAFTNRGRQEDLYLIRPDGTGLRKLTDDLPKERGVTWVDDERLVFYSNRGGGYEIWSIRTDGGDLRQLTETTGRALWFPEVTRDGTRMLTHNGEGTYVFELPGKGLLKKEDALHLTGAEGAEGVFRASRWSPDGTRILGTSVSPTLTSVAFYDFRTKEFRVFEAPGGGSSAEGGWLPDGRRFVATTGGVAWVVDCETAEWKELPFRTGTAVVRLAHDGRTLHYLETTTEADIWVARVQ